MIPLLAASEKGSGQTESSLEREIEMWCKSIPKSFGKSSLERDTSEGDSPVFDDDMVFCKRVGPPGLEV